MSASPAAVIPQFGVFEKIFAISGHRGNAYRDIAADAVFTRPDGSPWSIPLFYSSRGFFRLRVSPDAEGIWDYTITSPDDKLNGMSGRFDCAASRLRGGLQPMAGYPYHFQYQDATPVWLFGDTQWRAFATEQAKALNCETIFHYVDIRAEQGFNYIHTDLMGSGGIAGGDSPFESFAVELIRPEYFEEVDSRIRYMNARGITSGIVLAWHRGFPAWECFHSEQAVLRFARYITARYSAFNVVFIVSGEWDQIRPEKKPLFQAIGNEIMAHDPHGRMRGIHPCRRRTVEEFADEPWMSFGDYQQCYEAPHDRESTATERDALRRKILGARGHHKPVVNAEYGYYLRDMTGQEDYRQDIQGIDKPHSHTRESFRRASWVLAMAGAYFVTGFGTTYFGGRRNAGPFDVDDSRNDEAESDLAHIKRFFTSLEWWKPAVNDQLVSGSPGGFCYCLSAPAGPYIVYSEGNTSLGLKTGSTAVREARRYDPRHGTFEPIATAVTDGLLQLEVPNEQDWVFLVGRANPNERTRQGISQMGKKKELFRMEAAKPEIDKLIRSIDYSEALEISATMQEVRLACRAARQYGFRSVAVFPRHLELVVEETQGTEVLAMIVVGFPCGGNTTGAKCFEADEGLNKGATDLDMVMDMGAFKSGDYESVSRDIRAVLAVAEPFDVPCKVIVEVGVLTEQEKVTAAKLVADTGAAFIKTCTGFGPGKATLHDILLFRKTVGHRIGIKASGGVTSIEDGVAFMRAGAGVVAMRKPIVTQLEAMHW